MPKKRRRDRLIELAQQHDWGIGYLDEVWWSRFALPQLRLWSDSDTPMRLQEKVAAAQDPDPKALACYGLWWDDRKTMLLRFVDGRPVSHVTTAFLEWIGEHLWQQGRKVLVLIWDNASWHVSAEVQTWIREHNARAKRRGQGVRILVAGLPTKSPWLNKIEPKWKHGKEAIVEANRTVTAREVEERVCAYFETVPQAHLVQRKERPAAPVKRGAGAEKAAPLPSQAAHAAKTQ
jgi:transposase